MLQDTHLGDLGASDGFLTRHRMAWKLMGRNPQGDTPMFKKALAWAALATCLAIPSRAFCSNVSTVTVNATVDEIIEWNSATPTVTIANVAAINTPYTGNTTLALYSNHTANVSVAVTAGDANNGVLKEAGGDSLTTQYKLTGTGLASPDAAWVPAATFITNSYVVTYAAGQGTYQVIVNAQATAPAGRAPNQGAYTCDIVLTATGL
jgi:hypothetical protein